MMSNKVINNIKLKNNNNKTNNKNSCTNVPVPSLFVCVCARVCVRELYECLMAIKINKITIKSIHEIKLSE